jgi:hypothetical protein
MKGQFVFAITLLLATALFNASGCALANDFDKATLVGTLDLRKETSLRRELTVPAGRARLMIAVRNYRCAPIDATIQLSIAGPSGAMLSRRILLSQLTWSYGKDSCDAIGYLESSESKESRSAKDGNEMRLRFGRIKARYKFEAMTIDSNSATQRSVALWIIYGDRVPTAEVFGSGDDVSPR